MKALLLAVLIATALPLRGADKPNILYIMADDHAAEAIGAYGGRLAALNPTPTIDRLAREGAMLTNCFCTNSICTPSRATILTGQYSHVNGIRTLIGSLPEARQALPTLMKAAGYETAMVGKWHLEAEPSAFDFYSVYPGQGSYFNPIYLERGPKPWPQNTRRVAGADSTHESDSVTDISLAWLKGRKSDKPFFLMHHFKAPHDNFENAERYDFLYDDVKMPEPESLWSSRNYGSEATQGTGTSVGKRNTRRNMGMHMFVDPNLSDDEYKRVAYQRYMKKYLRCVRGVDDNVARLLDYLEKSGQLDNTLIIYTSDQGFMLGEHDYIDKRWMYEESLRMPFIARYPKLIKAGTKSDALINNTDFAPTLLAAAGGAVPEAMQGRSFLPMLRGESEPGDWRKATYYRYWMHMAHHDNPAHYGIRTKGFKLIFFYGLPLDAEFYNAKEKGVPTTPGWELYDLSKDPMELHNVYADAAYAKVRDDLKKELLRVKEQVGDTDENYPELMKVREKTW